MRFLSVLSLFVFVFALVSCKPAPKKITPELFIQIENEVLETDLTPESIKKITDKFNVSYEKYKEYEEKVESDPKLKEKIGEIRLNAHKK